MVTNSENLGWIATGSLLAVKGLRAYRGISAPKRPGRSPFRQATSQTEA